MLWTIATTSLLVLAASLPAVAQDATFDTDTVGSPPKGWMLTMTGKGAPKWTVEQRRHRSVQRAWCSNNPASHLPARAEGRHQHQGRLP